MAAKKKRKRRPGGGKQKGSAFERVICKGLSLWVSHGKREDLFWRSDMLGGRGRREVNRGGRKLSLRLGDVSAVDPLGEDLTGRFYVECKFYRDLQLIPFMFFGGGVLSKFWAETMIRARDYCQYPMLIVKQNRLPVLVVLTGKGLRELLQEPDFEGVQNRIGPVQGEGYCLVPLEKLTRTKYRDQSTRK